MSPDDLKAIRERAAKAREALGGEGSGKLDAADLLTCDMCGAGALGSSVDECDALLSLARSDVPALCDEVERLARERDEARAQASYEVAAHWRDEGDVYKRQRDRLRVAVKNLFDVEKDEQCPPMLRAVAWDELRAALEEAPSEGGPK